jgi:hypothetical protein
MAGILKERVANAAARVPGAGSVDILFQSEPQTHRLVGPQRNNGTSNGIQEQCHTNGPA